MEKVFEQIDNLFVNGVINGIISIIIAGIVLIAINKLLNKFIKKKWPDNYVFQKRIKKIILVTIFLAIVCSEVKFLKSFATALLASGGIVAVVIGLASQEAAGNLINGAMIMAYKPYKIGDFIVVTGHNVRGTVIDISLRHSVIETLEKTQMIVPNDIMNKAIIENISQILEGQDLEKVLADVAKIKNRHLALELIREMCMLSHVDNVLSDNETLIIGKIGLAMNVELEKIEQISNWIIDHIIWLEQAKIIFEEKN